MICLCVETAGIMGARQKRMELQDKKPEKVQAAASSSNARFRHAAAVNALSKNIRPRRYIETIK